MRLTVDDETARRLADEASRDAGFRISVTTVREVLAGRPVFRGGAAARCALERAGLHVPLLHEDER
jgi:hypothetical protein